jgi:hypothetical protein
VTEPQTPTPDTRQRHADARRTARREAFRLARQAGAPLVDRPIVRSGTEPAAYAVEPIAGARAARGLELAARSIARDYLRQAREAGHGWEQIGQDLALGPGGDRGHDSPAIDVDDVLFRMLKPDEIGAAMAFVPGYRVLGCKREKTRQFGNAVTPPVAEMLIAALAEAIIGEAIA